MKNIAGYPVRLRGSVGISLLLTLLLLLALSVTAQDTKENAAESYFTNVELVDQNGKSHRLYQDLIKDKVVVINSFFSTSTGPDLPTNRNLEIIQDKLSGYLGKQLLIISITVDPETDTPELLHRYAERFHSVNGRLFLTGTKTNVDFALRKLGLYAEVKEDHSNILIVGNGATGLWKKALGLAKAEDLVEIVRSVIEDKGN